MPKETNKEKARLFQGKDHWVLNHGQEEREVRLSDGPNGLRIEKENKPGFNPSYPANLYPSASCIACSFDEDLMHEYGYKLGEECRYEGVDVLLGPGVNHKRSPLGGRNFEYLSEDPLVSGKLAAAYIRGLQDTGTGACLKHLAANSREKTRMTMDAVVDERTLHELYLRQFEIAVKEGRPWAVMPAYNKLNGIHCTENKELLDEVRSWGFDGIFISDWGAVSSPEDALNAGLNLEMPGGAVGADEVLLDALASGKIKQIDLDRNAERIHAWINRFNTHDKRPFDQKEHESFLLKAAEKGSVLLKNNAVLPLHSNQKIAVIGELAEHPMNQGSGSSHVEPCREDSFLQACQKENISYEYARGYRIMHKHPDALLEKEAVKAAVRKDAVIFFAGPFPNEESEGYDRNTMALPECQTALIHKLAEVNSHLIVVLECGAPVDVSWQNDVQGILCMYFGGMRSSEACLHLLFGERNPCGHLSETWPLTEKDIPCNKWFNQSAYESQYRETIFSGYRYYDTYGIKTAWPFGYGLSYTSFAYHDFQVKNDGHNILVSLDVENTGNYDGEALIQIYASMPESRIWRSKAELADFMKVCLKAGEAKDIHLEIPVSHLSYWDTRLHQWSIEEGEYVISLRSDAENILAEKAIHLDGNFHPYTSIHKEYFVMRDHQLEVSQDNFEKILGHPLAEKKNVKPFNPDTMLCELSACRLGKVINGITHLILHLKPFKGVSEEMVFTSPLRQMLWMNERISWKTVRLSAQYMNHHRFKTLKKIVKSMQRA